MIETDGVAMCVHYRRLKVDRLVPSSVAPSAKHEEKKVADPATQEVEDNDVIVGAAKHEDEKEPGPAAQEVEDNDVVIGTDPGHTNIIPVAEPKRAEDGIDGNVRQKDMRLLRFLEIEMLSRIRYCECKEES